MLFRLFWKFHCKPIVGITLFYLLLTRMNYVNMNLICSLTFHWYLAILIIMGWLFCFILNLQSWWYSKKCIIRHEKQPLHANQVQLNCIWDEHAFLLNFRQYVAFTLPFGTEPFDFTMKIHAILIHWWAHGTLTGVHEAHADKGTMQQCSQSLSSSGEIRTII